MVANEYSYDTVLLRMCVFLKIGLNCKMGVLFTAERHREWFTSSVEVMLLLRGKI